MLMTVLEAHIPAEKWDALQRSFAVIGTRNLPSTVRETFLVHSTSDPTLWQVIVFWHSQAGFEEMRQQGTLAGVLLFRSLGTEPKLSVWDVPAHGPDTSDRPAR